MLGGGSYKMMMMKLLNRIQNTFKSASSHKHKMSESGKPHVALLASAGLGHLMPCLRLAALILSKNIKLTLITFHPIVSNGESRFLSEFLTAFPQTTTKELHLLPLEASKDNDPFLLQFEAISRSVSLLSPIIATSSPPLSAFITDISLASAVIPITSRHHLPIYILAISSALMFALVSHYPTLIDQCKDSSELSEEIEIPNVPKISKSWLPPILLDFTSLFSKQVCENGRDVIKANGILINSFHHFEPETLKAFSQGKVRNEMPPFFTIGPFVPCEFEKGSALPWLDNQPERSVVYVCFGNRSAMTREQIREVGVGLEKSGCRFLWVVKSTKVDKEDKDELEEILGEGFIERVKDKGLVIKSWVAQETVLSHPSVKGFLNHAGWNSMLEAARHGVPMMVWPLGGDQKISAEVVRSSGLGIWMENWGWNGEKLVRGEEIGETIRKFMGDDQLRLRALQLRELARKSVGVGGSSHAEFTKFIQCLEHPPQ